MRTIKFTSEELPVLKEIIELGNAQYDNNFPEISKVILNKIRIEIFTFSVKELQVLRSYSANWINDNDNLIDNFRDKYLVPKIIDCEKVTQPEKETMKKIDLVFSIKSKLFREKYISFKGVLEGSASKLPQR